MLSHMAACRCSVIHVCSCTHKHKIRHGCLPLSTALRLFLHFLLTFSHPSLPAVTPFCLCIKGAQHHNNSRHDSLTLTLHIMELEVLGASDVRVTSLNTQCFTEQRARNTMVPKWNKVCSRLREGAKLPTWEQESWRALLSWVQPEKRDTLCSGREFTIFVDWHQSLWSKIYLI